MTSHTISRSAPPTEHRLDLVFPVLPPVLDGIGDYTACLATHLAPYTDVRVLTASPSWDDIPDVEVQRAFSADTRRGVHDLAEVVASDPPQWLVVQYNPFSYGTWGLNPYLPLVIRQIRRRVPGLRVALMVHEPFLRAEHPKAALMSLWQRGQLWALGRASDVVFFSIESWAGAFQGWFPNVPVHHLPVGSNIPRGAGDRFTARLRAGIDPGTFVVGIFGGAHRSRLLPFIGEAVRGLAHTRETLCVLYIGTAGRRVREAVGNAAFVDAGPLPPDDVSTHFDAMDLYLAPFRKGVSTRRGSFMVGLQHGIPTVSTYGVHTGPMLKDQDGSAFLLTPDDDAGAFASAVVRLAGDAEGRARLGQGGWSLFEKAFSWPRIAERMWDALSGYGVGKSSVAPLLP